ncbi:MAG: hypothetical protein KA775_04660 [Ottowia sp.]|jgi:uncharacterized protein (DUF697 family)|uniref:DUF697 domain-containing protein n=1 Tax=Ottowia beijingensis TaxID=1207057 RepID=A0A853IRF2_9BURK|nr:hypothetical protein [Ottowia beijingensis]MBP6780355.1 hypothetical protein [Ottowia sp.]MBP8780890.1 hypothetical protein [Alicycliphilus sp.]MBP7531092.1 hypothetical protein [Ottowia sp.]MBP7538215.1 hypothetical protein [Ottowia sp.]MBP9954956.1 hypothetical protein [Ottowia sp.]
MAKAKSPNAMELARGHTRLEQAVQRSRQMLRKRALVAGVAGMVPLPGLDWAADAAMLAQLLPKINAEFGLTPQQIAKLDAREKERVQKAIAMVGSVLIGRLVTRGLVLRAARLLGMRLTTAQAAKYVPIAGQLVSGALGYAALQYLGEQHIRDCVRVALASPLALPAPEGVREHRQDRTVPLGADAATT